MEKQDGIIGDFVTAIVLSRLDEWYIDAIVQVDEKGKLVLKLQQENLKWDQVTLTKSKRGF